MEVLRHAEHHDVVFFLRPRDVGAFICQHPRLRLHLGGVAGIDLELTGEGVEHGVAAEEGMTHFFLHVHADLIKERAHHAVAGDGGEVLPVHDLRHVVAGDGAPVGDAGGAVLVAAGVAAVGVALRVTDEDGDVTFKDVFVHQHRRVVPGRAAEVDHVLRILGVVAGDLAGIIKFAEQLVAQDLFHLRHGGAGVQAVGDEQQDVLFLNTSGVQLIEARADGDLAVRRCLTAALDDVRDDEHDRLSRRGQLAQRRHPVGVADGVQRCGVQAVPVLRQAGGIRHGLAGDKHVGRVRQLRRHQTRAIFKFQFHGLLLICSDTSG